MEHQGLTTKEANEQIEKYGKNELKEQKKKPMLFRFALQFHDVTIYILMAASVISFFLREFFDGCVILFVIFLNALIGMLQEAKAEKSLEMLKKISSPTAWVMRDGEKRKIPCEEVTMGDVVILEEGDIVPADLVLLEAVELSCDESSLTGESIPVMKEVGEKENGRVFRSTMVTSGHGLGRVEKIGMQTEIGRIAGLIHASKVEKTPLQKRLADLGKWLGILILIICAILFVFTLIQKQDPFEMFLSSISLAVAAIPEGLPAVVTIVLAIGVERLAKKKMIVRRLPSVETLGSVSSILTDKTGTLTENKMEVQRAVAPGYDSVPSLFVQGMMDCNNATEKGGEPTESALWKWANKQNVSRSSRLFELPFSSKRKNMVVTVKIKQDTYTFMKGAMDVVLEGSRYLATSQGEVVLTKEKKKEIWEEEKKEAENGRRILGLCYQKGEYHPEKPMIFLGFVSLSDPLRKEIPETVQALKEAGIQTIMVTGDQPETAFAIAKEAGIASSMKEVVSGKELAMYQEEDWKTAVENVRVFARVTPENKLQIVKAFQKDNQIVAMTGDGVNDAPALKCADIGIAMGLIGTDVAKASSDMILTDDRYDSIKNAVEEGRNIYANIKKTVLFLLSSNLAEVLSMLVAVLVGLPMPLIAVQILFVNLITDSFPGVALGIDKGSHDVMREKPRNKKESLFAQGGMMLVIFYGVLITLTTLLSFLIIPFSKACAECGNATMLERIAYLQEVLQNEDVLAKARTCAFVNLSMSQLFHMIGMSDVKSGILGILKKKNWLMMGTFLVGTLIQVLMVVVPPLRELFHLSSLTISEWIGVICISMLPIVVHEFWIPFFQRKSL